jgi:single-stranded DNA-binding protein
MVTVCLTGRLTRDPELRQVSAPEGAADLCEVRIAARDSRGRTVFLDCAQWGAGARSAAERLEKGSPVAFTGELRLREVPSEYGTRQFYSGVGRIEFLGGPRMGEAAPEPDAVAA